MNVQNGNLLVLANAVELGINVINRIVGESVSDSIGGKVQSNSALATAVGARFQTSLNKYKGSK